MKTNQRNIISFVGAFIVLCALTGCKPSSEQQARVAEQRREHDLNTILPTDPDANIDTTKYVRLKRGGKFFIAPREYFQQGNMHGFYWPSKTPKFTSNSNYPERSAVAAGKIDTVEIAFQLESSNAEGGTYGVLQKAAQEGVVIERETIRDGLDKVKRANQRGMPIYVATNLKTPSGEPPALSCDERGGGHAGTSGFVWKKDLRIYVSFSANHCKDWPEIYTEIIRVLNLVKEA